MSQQEQWQLSGNASEVYEHYLVPAVFGPWAPVLVERAALQAGERVLDVACGTGIVARVAAQQVGTTGKIVGLDTNAAMLMVARSLPMEPGVSIEWQEGSALALPYSDAAFDVVFCQLGLQYFPDRPLALREMRRVLVLRGRLALLVWGPIEQSPGYALLAEAQFRDIDIRTSVGRVHFPSSEDFVRHQVAGSPLAGPVSQADGNARSALMSEVRAALQPYVHHDGLDFPIQAHLVSAHT
jgi:SAM-dependent methyltransferase